MSELLSCPFCGSSRVEVVGHFPFVRCKECEAETDNYDDKEAAAEAWNTRAERTCEIVHDDLLSEQYYGPMARCSHCGAALPEEFIGPYYYCPRCGAKVVE